MGAMLDAELKLPCGVIIPNRLAKAAMTEGLATPDGRPTPELERLYGIWSDGGAGLLLSGNVIVDKDHLERPGNVVIEAEPDGDMKNRLRRWAQAATRSGNQFWAQISHGGRQTQKVVNPTPKSSSDVALDLPGGLFGTPSPLSVDEIADLVTRWAIAARACQEAGFTGVEIHGAHGYLISQFLSPRVNHRTDDYGGTLENRARFLLEIVAAVREAVGPEFPVSVKLNSADFQKGGFNFEDSLAVVEWLEAASVDLIEISGGTYEQPKLAGKEGIEPEEKQNVAQSTAAREAYFVDFAKAMQAKVQIPLMVTGGFRTRQAMEQALESGAADLIGLARPMCLMTDAPQQLLDGMDTLPRYEDDLGLLPNWLGFLRRFKMMKAMDGFAGIYWFYQQLWMLGHEGRVDARYPVLKAFRTVDRRNQSIMAARKLMANAVGDPQ
ncbi:NADH:flavin oxidoreductase/NADH oxidase family protein [Alterisphingorhabdus coralli]|uniref:NADH:flavin oxidoreductase/NADH oxidase family protein n=1 Tax=Alterisphingorhabdus coralli TaxID=3071408 RepID=A0AA97I1F3_9SPHN|nr:NADH:flavin oxidoreductase/NADH oxidase family protein [Parasphingorhabdus sp. SCSIO 66989]WOE74675.1 NADH:flavin oxidoreductase/NADH oxidase family protein [Parasphingorhabdus sp. SCSIO 66989]